MFWTDSIQILNMAFILINDTHLHRCRFLDIIGINIKSAVGCSEDVAVCYDRTPTKRFWWTFSI